MPDRTLRIALAQVNAVVGDLDGNTRLIRAAVAEASLDADAYLYRDRTADAFLPWQIIDGGFKTAFFRQELAKSDQAEWTLPPKRLRDKAPEIIAAGL